MKGNNLVIIRGRIEGAPVVHPAVSGNRRAVFTLVSEEFTKPSKFHRSIVEVFGGVADYVTALPENAHVQVLGAIREDGGVRIRAWEIVNLPSKN